MTFVFLCVFCEVAFIIILAGNAVNHRIQRGKEAGGTRSIYVDFSFGDRLNQGIKAGNGITKNYRKEA